MFLISCHLNFKLTTYTDVLMHIHTTDDDIFAAEELFSLFPILKMFKMLKRQNISNIKAQHWLLVTKITQVA